MTEPKTFKTDKQEFLQDIESIIDCINENFEIEPDYQPELMTEFQDKVIELSKIHNQLKMLGY